MIVRDSLPCDIDSTIEVCIQYAKEIGAKIDLKKVREVFDSIILGEQGIMGICIEDGDILGVVGCLFCEELFSHRMVYQEIIWHSSPNLGKIKRTKIQSDLLDWLVEKTKGFNLIVLNRHSTSLDTLLERRGATLIERAYKFKRV